VHPLSLSLLPFIICRFVIRRLEHALDQAAMASRCVLVGVQFDAWDELPAAPG
jgi:hypothetical protein